MIVKNFPGNIEIPASARGILFGGDRLNGVTAFSVIEDDNKTIAMASLSLKGDFNLPEIVGVYVNENYRGNGLAKKLIKELVDYSKEIQLKDIVIQLITKESSYLNSFCESVGLKVYDFKSEFNI